MSKKAPVPEPEPEKVVESQVLSGSGKFSFPDGSFYDGEWKETNGVKYRDGTGTFTCGPESYKGSWVNDQMEGDGVYVFASGAVYTGSFARNRFNGNGKYHYADGAYYIGEWRDGKMHGEGEYVDTSKVSWKGQYFNGMFDTGKSYVTVRPAKKS